MEVLIVTNSYMLREVVENFFHTSFKNCKINSVNNIKNLEPMNSSQTDLVIIDVEKDITQHLDTIKAFSKLTKILVYDRRNNKEVFVALSKAGVAGYLVDRPEKEELIHIVKKILKGKKHYDAELFESILNLDFATAAIKPFDMKFTSINEEQINLTNREREVLLKVQKGYSNKEISEQLYITEHTIKKHITSILSKLNMKNRKELIYSGNIDSFAEKLKIIGF